MSHVYYVEETSQDGVTFTLYSSKAKMMKAVRDIKEEHLTACSDAREVAGALTIIYGDSELSYSWGTKEIN